MNPAIATAAVQRTNMYGRALTLFRMLGSDNQTNAAAYKPARGPLKIRAHR